MKWYASWGHTDFILCLGHRAEVVKDYFLKYNEALANDFVLSNGGRDVELLGSRYLRLADHLRRHGRPVLDRRTPAACRPHLGDDEYFLATYGDGVTDAPLDEMIATLAGSGKTGLFISVKPRLEYHLVRSNDDGVVTGIELLAQADVRINGGYFVFRRDILDAIEPGEELVERAIRPPHPARGASRISARRLLGADGHDQGQATARGSRSRAAARPGNETPTSES